MRIKRKQNRKKNLFGTAFAMVLCSGLLLFYLWLQFSVHRLGYHIKQQETQLTELKDERARMESLVSRIESPANLERQIKGADLGLKPTNTLNVIQVNL